MGVLFVVSILISGMKIVYLEKNDKRVPGACCPTKWTPGYFMRSVGVPSVKCYEYP